MLEKQRFKQRKLPAFLKSAMKNADRATKKDTTSRGNAQEGTEEKQGGRKRSRAGRYKDSKQRRLR